jgi:hypothetical protein
MLAPLHPGSMTVCVCVCVCVCISHSNPYSPLTYMLHQAAAIPSHHTSTVCRATPDGTDLTHAHNALHGHVSPSAAATHQPEITTCRAIRTAHSHTCCTKLRPFLRTIQALCAEQPRTVQTSHTHTMRCTGMCLRLQLQPINLKSQPAEQSVQPTHIHAAPSCGHSFAPYKHCVQSNPGRYRPHTRTQCAARACVSVCSCNPST